MTGSPVSKIINLKKEERRQSRRKLRKKYQVTKDGRDLN